MAISNAYNVIIATYKTFKKTLARNDMFKSLETLGFFDNFVKSKAVSITGEHYE